MYTRIRLCHNHHPETAGEDGDYLVVRPSDGEDSRAGRHKRRQARRPAADRRHRRRPGNAGGDHRGSGGGDRGRESQRGDGGATRTPEGEDRQVPVLEERGRPRGANRRGPAVPGGRSHQPPRRLSTRPTCTEPRSSKPGRCQPGDATQHVDPRAGNGSGQATRAPPSSRERCAERPGAEPGHVRTKGGPQHPDRGSDHQGGAGPVHEDARCQKPE